MKPEEINKAIAEYCGWKHRSDGMWYMPDGSTVGENLIPNYYANLNTMHEAEKVLDQSQQFEYHNHLFNILPCDENHGSMFEDREDIMTPSGFTMLHATAPQRAEAFLRAIGKWRDSDAPSEGNA